ncbi:hypothetical protein [Vallicoccus soli]|uniref:Uncharacterized protein n=1 Tax=Vallicoccus soli TaxID=2339232 RepID=A0A3A3Z436_9ACTN|nr:hypothetical protein [Vallicoccus soli]RJK98164.1 hypothetical protein D5H78_04450 [Vallicoccus soli]
MTAAASRSALAAGLLLLVAVLLVRVVLAPRYPLLDGTLEVARDGGATVATARWATDGPVPERRRDCTTTVLVLPPPGALQVRAEGDAAALEPGAREVERVLDQYGRVLPADLPSRVRAWALPAGEAGSLTATWDGGGDPSAVRAWVAPVCPETVHGIVELSR